MFNYYPGMQQNNYPGFPGGNDERIWVQNKNAADAYLMAPNSFVRLWDANEPIFYEKRTDATGRPMPLEVYEYSRKKPIEASSENNSIFDYKKDLDGLKGRIELLERKINETDKQPDDYDSEI